jgi:NAD(P)-dependent dehydrogenase (short-subunit alcohol dehydrogenase family)
MWTLANKVVVVTGASRGLGREIATTMAGAGAILLLTSNEPLERLESVAAECREAGAKRVEAVSRDLSVPYQAEEMVEDARRYFGRIDVLVNNAGMRMRKFIGEYAYDDFDSIVAVNLRAPFFASQAAAALMRSAGGGRIINIASQMGVVAQQGIAMYGATKAALIHLTKTLALELAGDNIQVNAVSPGPAATETNVERMERTPELHAERMRYMPTGELVGTQEVAEAVLFLAAAQSHSLQGHNLVLDGGYTIH